MPDQDAVGALIERIVAGARIPRACARDDLRRELRTYFEDAGATPETMPDVLARFGAESLVTQSLRRVYRIDYAAAYLVKIAASVVASAAAALVIQALASVRVDAQAAMWRLTPGFARSAGVSIAVVLGLVTAWEAARPPLTRSRAAVAIAAYAAICLLAQALFATGAAFLIPTILVVLGYGLSILRPKPLRLLVIFGTFAAVLYARHAALNVAFGPGRALLASAVLVAVWSSTVLILERLDHAFVRVLEPTRPEA